MRLTGLENIGPERTLSGLLGNVPVNCPTRITLENNGKIRTLLNQENAFAGASGGGDGSDVEPSPSLNALIILKNTPYPPSETSFRKLAIAPSEPYRLVADLDAAFMQKVLDIAQRQRESDALPPAG